MTDTLTRTRFFFDFRSPYSYLASTQLDSLPGTFDWRPFDVLELMKRVGNVPTSVICKPKQAYARQDLGRWAALYRAQLSPNPGMSGVDGPRLLHAALAARSLGHGEEAGRRLFRAMWAGDAPLATSDDVAALLADLGVTAAMIDAPERATELEAGTAAAVEAGVFGAPSFVTEGGLLFFGNDRLDFLRRALAA
ncbi:MAG: 2-hydroxychromene-2-carboxylate isomerase [Phenylobacterium sp.]|uniref:2-hydroxychromene-2-carboxylate isomerase n=1 Tax=Phenylobacterium sp. TaxID=1871053 RepID=UPI0025D77780|nr:2-hydroxychromene-2-carboxylate isomerase [Phenylobacterium sp.]MBA4011366.1 2-hydroxychromene-2-carboxylate isomerase [Phenylobacterium sp.]